MSLSLTELESAMASNRAAKADVEREIAKLRDHRQRTLLSGDIDAIEEIDTQIRRHEIEVEIAAARIQSLNGDLYLAREERKRWANFAATNFVMPDSDELARLIEIVREAEPDLRFDDEEFKRSFWAVGQMWRAAEIDKSRYFVSYVDDASDLLRLRRQSSVSGSSFLAAAIAHGDIFWQRGDAALGVVTAVALNKNHGRQCSNRWRDLLADRASLLESISPAGQRASSSTYPHRGVTVYQEGTDGAMHETDPIAPLWVQ
jgi:hypothetical protein